jgi:Flp pilus assembly protein TadD
MRPNGRTTTIRSSRLLASAALLAVIAAAMAGCQTMQIAETTGVLPVAAADQSSADAHHDADVYGQQYRADPSNVETAMRYAQALRKTGQRAQAVAILEKASIESPHNKAVLGAYGRALAEAGNYDQALQVLDRAHTPESAIATGSAGFGGCRGREI